MRVLRDFIIVRIAEEYREKVKTKSGLEFFIDPTYRPEHHVTMEGECVHIPETLSGDFLYTRGIFADVLPGDKVYFNYLTVCNENKIVVDGQTLYKVDYGSVFGYKRAGEIHMIGSWTFIKPYVEKKPEKVGFLYLPDMLQSEERKDTGIIWKIGKPLKHEPDLGLKDGDMVLFRQTGAFEHEVEGEKVYVMRQEHIMAKYENI